MFIKYGRHLILLIILSLPTLHTDAKTLRLSLRKALLKKLVSIKAISNGGYCGKGLTVQLEGNTRDTISVNMETGLVFKPDDKECQPLILLGEEPMVLNGCERKNAVLQTYCGNASAHSPYRGINYTLAGLTDTNLVSILKYAKRNNIDHHLIQSCVWAVTNNHPIYSIYHHSVPTESERFVKYVATKLKRKMPSYFMEYALDSSGRRPMIRQGEENLYLNMSWNATQGYRNVYVSVYKPDGTLYKRVENNIVSDKYGSAVVVNFSPRRDPAGKYIVRLHDDGNNVLQEKIIHVGQSPDMY